MTARTNKEGGKEFQVQLNTRIPLSLRQRLEDHLDALYVMADRNRLGKREKEWPQTLTGVVEQALENYLATHEVVTKPGPLPQPGKPEPAPKPPTPKLKPKKAADIPDHE